MGITNGLGKVMIPKIIWQTYESDYETLYPLAKEYSRSWIEKNPSWEYRYMSAQDREDFVLEHFGSEWLSVFKSYPFGVMRANIWRYMVLYVYGGVYSDIDTICNDPIESWVKSNYSLIVSGDAGGEDFCFYNATFAADKNSIFLKSVIDLAMERYTNNKSIDYSNIYNMFYYSGSILFTDGIIRILDKKLNPSYNKDYIEYGNAQNAEMYGFFCYGGEDHDVLSKKYITHIDASINWDSSYIKWRNEVKEYRRK